MSTSMLTFRAGRGGMNAVSIHPTVINVEKQISMNLRAREKYTLTTNVKVVFRQY